MTCANWPRPGPFDDRTWRAPPPRRPWRCHGDQRRAEGRADDRASPSPRRSPDQSWASSCSLSIQAAAKWTGGTRCGAKVRAFEPDVFGVASSGVRLGVCPSIAFRRRGSNNPVPCGTRLSEAAELCYEQDLSRQDSQSIRTTFPLRPRIGCPKMTSSISSSIQWRPSTSPPSSPITNANCVASLRSIPGTTVALLLYCYATGTRSSCKIMRRCRTDSTWPAASSSVTTSPTSAPSATSARRTWASWRPCSLRSSSRAPWPGW